MSDEKQTEQQPTESAAVPARPVEGTVRLFCSLPLGTRFTYLNDEDIEHERIWVVLGRSGCGLIASWEGVESDTRFQAICSFADTQEECNRLSVIVVA